MRTPFLFFVAALLLASKPRGVDAFNGACNLCQVLTQQICTCGNVTHGTNGTNGATGTAGQDALPSERVLLQGEFPAGCAPLQRLNVAAGYTTRLLNAWGVGEQPDALRPTWLLLSTERDEFTLANSEYRIEATAPASAGITHRLALYRTTTPVGYVAHGPTVLGSSVASLSARVNVTGASATFRLSHWASAASTLGIAASISATINEVYEQVVITKLTNLREAYALGVASATPAFIPQLSAYTLASTTITSTAAAQAVVFGGAVYQQRACLSLLTPTLVRALKTATYLVYASMQVTLTSSATTDMAAWLRVNGVDVVNSASSVSLQMAGDVKLQAMTFLVPLDAGDTVTVMWRASSMFGTIVSVAAGASPVRPLVPAVVFAMVRLVTTFFLSLTDSSVQTAPTASTTATGAVITFDTVAVQGAAGMSLVANSRITTTTAIARSHVYTLSVQVAGASALTTIEIWAQQAGTIIANSNTRHSLTGPGDVKTVTVTLTYPLTASDHNVTFVWCPSVAGAVITATPAGTSPTRPAAPGATLLAHTGISGVAAMHYISIADQVAPAATTSALVLFATFVGAGASMTATSTSRFTTASTATYLVTVGLHCSSNAATLFDFWLAVDGVPVPNSGAQQQVPGDLSVKYMARTQLVYMTASSYIEVFWRTSVVGGASGTKLAAFDAVGTTRPAIPSARIVIQRGD